MSRWRALKRWQRWTIGGVAVVVVLLVIGSLTSEENEPPYKPYSDEEARALIDRAHRRASPSPAAPTQDEDERRSEALGYLREADAAIADDDPAGARALLAQVPDDVLDAQPDIARRVSETRRRARLTERYISAADLAGSGSYLAARRGMLAIAPFRDAERKARGYATQAARGLVSKARGVYESRPDRALDLLDRADDLAPNLASIDAVRALAIGRQEDLATPAPTPDPAQAAPSCDTNYSGACIPVVSYDLDCDEVAAANFASVGSDPHGFDREGDGLACEG